MKNLQNLLAFVETAESGSLTAAAQRLEITPAAISKALAKLEKQLGVRLIHRTTRRMSLTTEGERFLGRARAALKLLDEAVAEVGEAGQTPAGAVRILVGTGFGRRWVLPQLPAIAARYPLVTLDVELDNRPIDLVASGIDIGIRGGYIEDANLVARRICPLPLVLVASPGYLAEHGVPQTPDDLERHRCTSVHFAHRPLPPWHFTTGGGERIAFAPVAQIATTDPEGVADIALAGGGIAQIGLHHALPYLRDGQLKLVLSHCHDPGSREMVLHHPNRRDLPSRVTIVIDQLMAEYARSEELHFTVSDVASRWPDCVARSESRSAIHLHTEMQKAS